MLEYIRNATNMLWFGTKKSEPAPAPVVVEETPCETQRFPVMYYYAVMNGLSIRCPASETEKEEHPVQTNEESKIPPIDSINLANLMLDMGMKARLEREPPNSAQPS
ncbi:MAG TPA: hypothetical protein VGF14_01515 [Alphaproteobacteria bacterium]